MYIGVDLVKIKRWEKIIEKYPERLKKIFTTEEIEHCEKKGRKKAESYAALWGAREAAGKALGIGLQGATWQDAYVTWTNLGAPVLHLKGEFKRRAAQMGIKTMAMSISHEDNLSITVVVLGR